MEELLKFTLLGSDQEIINSYNSINIYDKHRMSLLNIRASYIYNNNDRYVLFLLIDKNDKNIYENILEINNIIYLCDNISVEVINNEIDIFTLLNSKLNIEDILLYQIFQDELLQWISENLNIDIILDRINTFGMENLRDVDYKFLDLDNL